MKKMNNTNEFLCKSILNVSSHEEIITVFLKNMSFSQSLISIFSLQTTLYNRTVYFPSGSARLYSNNSNSISFYFYLPAIGDYQASLVCQITTSGQDNISDQQVSSPTFHLNLSTKILQLIMNIQEFSVIRVIGKIDGVK
jgi:hypothetical protein